MSSGESQCGKFKLWSEPSMQKAYDAVQRGTSVQIAAARYCVPKSTLHDRVIGKVALGCRSGPSTYLSCEEEECLVKFLVSCARIGYAKSKRQVLAIVSAILSQKLGLEGSDEKPLVTKGWWQSFCKRHPQLSIRCAEQLPYARAIATNQVVVDDYFNLLEDTMHKNKLAGCPHLIFNCDESGFPLDHEGGKLVAVKGWRHFWAASSCNRDRITVLACVSANGYAMPPLIIYDRKNIRQEFRQGAVPGTMFRSSSKGWINGDIFQDWLLNNFIPHAPATRPLLLLLDGHSSHHRPCMIEQAASKGVLIFCLPPHTTHYLQPLDKTVFGPLKLYWREECRRFMANDPGRIITRADFSSIFSKAWVQGLSAGNIVAGFKATGVYPLNRRAIKIPSSSDPVSPVPKNVSSAISFLPLYSPRKNTVQPVADLAFSQDQLTTYERRLEEGYDLPGDASYNRWLEIYHPEICHSQSKTQECRNIVSDSVHGGVSRYDDWENRSTTSLQLSTEDVVIDTSSSSEHESANDGISIPARSSMSSMRENAGKVRKGRGSGTTISSSTRGKTALTRPPSTRGRSLQDPKAGAQSTKGHSTISVRGGERVGSPSEDESAIDENSVPARSSMSSMRENAGKVRKGRGSRTTVSSSTRGKSALTRPPSTRGRSLQDLKGNWCSSSINRSVKQRNIPKSVLDDLLVTPLPLYKQERFSHKVHKACLLTSQEHIEYLKKKDAAKKAKGWSGTVKTECSKKTCANRYSTEWIQCKLCKGWYNCVCTNVEWEAAEELDFVCFICM